MEESIEKKVRAWLAAPEVDEETKAEIRRADESRLAECFRKDLSFGTGGLRGVLDFGTDRMNVYTIRRATQGLANYLSGTALPKKVAVAYDSRIHSRDFALAAAGVLAAAGIRALVYPRLEPTPALSFAVRDQGCGAGICITASHNPAKYNGYKVYGPDGCQITLQAAERIQAAIEQADIFSGVRYLSAAEAEKDGLLQYLGEDVLDRFLQAVHGLALQSTEGMPELSVVYTPLNGTGLECVRRALTAVGVKDIHVVEEQQTPDGRFPTCPYPNPEIREALALGLRDCGIHHPDLLLATDPDCDRLGIAVRDGSDYKLLTGNEVGVLLLDYICRTRIRQGTMPNRPVAVTTVVSGAMADPVARKYGVELWRTLTGFKFIGEQIGLLEAQGEADRFIFGFEESYGYLSGSHVRDKDAVNASLLICEAARWYKSRGMTLADAVKALYEEFGCYTESLRSYTFDGADGAERMQALINALRDAPPRRIGGASVESITDYLPGADLPSTDMLAFHLAGGCKAMVRPSGTEPKLKAYLFARAKNADTAAEKIQAIGIWLDQYFQ